MLRATAAPNFARCQTSPVTSPARNSTSPRVLSPSPNSLATPLPAGHRCLTAPRPPRSPPRRRSGNGS
eukprot:10055973-Lingulodinium_polyedra.AAC.1